MALQCAPLEHVASLNVFDDGLLDDVLSLSPRSLDARVRSWPGTDVALSPRAGAVAAGGGSAKPRPGSGGAAGGRGSRWGLAATPLPRHTDSAGLRCLDGDHGADCNRCVQAPTCSEDGAYEICGDAGKKNGEKKLRAQLSRTKEWSDAAARVAAADAADASDHAERLAVLSSVMHGRGGTSAALRKVDLLFLARHWGYKSDLWQPRRARRAEGDGAAGTAQADSEVGRRRRRRSSTGGGTAQPPRAARAATAAAQCAPADAAGNAEDGEEDAACAAAWLEDSAQRTPSRTSSLATAAAGQMAQLRLPHEEELSGAGWLAQAAAAPLWRAPAAAAQEAAKLPALRLLPSLLPTWAQPTSAAAVAAMVAAPAPSRMAAEIEQPPVLPSSSAAAVAAAVFDVGSFSLSAVRSFLSTTLRPLSSQAGAAFAGAAARAAALAAPGAAAHVTPAAVEEVRKAVGALAIARLVWRARAAEAQRAVDALPADLAPSVAWACFLGKGFSAERWLAEVPDVIHRGEALCPTRDARAPRAAPWAAAEAAWLSELRAARCASLELLSHLQVLLAQAKFARLDTCMTATALVVELVSGFVAGVVEGMAAREAWMDDIIQKGKHLETAPGAAPDEDATPRRPIFVWAGPPVNEDYAAAGASAASGAGFGSEIEAAMATASAAALAT